MTSVLTDTPGCSHRDPELGKFWNLKGFELECVSTENHVRLSESTVCMFA